MSRRITFITRAFQKEKERCHERLAQWIEDTGDDFELPDIRLE